MTQTTFNLYETMLCNRCGIYAPNEMHMLLDELPNEKKSAGERIVQAYQIATQMFTDTIHSRLANMSLGEKKAVTSLLKDEGFYNYCNSKGIRHKSARCLLAFVIVAYGDGCAYDDVVLSMTDEEILKLCKDPTVYHFVKNLFKHNVSNETCREYIRILLSHRPAKQRTKETLAYIVRHGIN